MIGVTRYNCPARKKSSHRVGRTRPRRLLGIRPVVRV